MKKITKLLILISSLFLILVGCNDNGESVSSEEDGSMTFGIVFKNVGNPLGDSAMDGFTEAVEEHGHTAITRAPDEPTVEGQISIIQELIDQNVDGIAISANDPDALQPVLQNAMNQDIPVVTYDSTTNPESRTLHIEQADSELVGQVLADSTHDVLDGEGQYAILSATSTATNQNTWIEEMQNLIEEDPKYEDLELANIVYGDDLRDKSTEEAEGLIQSYPDLEAIIAPSTVGLAATAKVVEDNNLGEEITVTGLGLPSEMAAYIDSGVTPYMHLWNPIDMGYMAGQATVLLATGEISAEAGETFEAGSLGEKQITESEDGGLESILGEPFRFDPENIDEWADVF
jgi:rhamnose transport system substrate-binding protein